MLINLTWWDNVNLCYQDLFLTKKYLKEQVFTYFYLFKHG